MWIDRTGECPYDRHHTQTDQTHLRGDRRRERGRGRLRGSGRLRSRLAIRSRLRLMHTLAERCKQLAEATQWQALEAEPVAYLRHCLHGTVHAVVEVHSGRALFTSDHLPLPEQRGFAHASVASNVEEELVVVAFRISAQVLPKGVHLAVSAHEPASSTAPDQLLS